MVSPPGPMGYGVWLFEVCAHSKVGTPAPHCSLPPLQVPQHQPVSPMGSSGPKKSWRPIELWHLHDSEWPGCASPMILEVQETMLAVLLDNPEEISLRTPGVAWLRHLRSCWSAAQSRWLHLEIGRTKAISPKLPRWPSTTHQRSMQPPSRSNLWCGEPHPS